MRLICNGEALDIRANTRLALKKVNPLFAFDKITCERTTELDLPATPTNDRIFSVAKEPAYIGEGMRRRFKAQLQSGAVTKDGYLYVSKFTKGSYKAVFVTGELVGLKAIKDAGKLADILYTDVDTIWNTGYIPDLPARAETVWSVTKYMQDGAVRPSMFVNSLVRLAAQSLQFSVTLPQNKLRLIPPKVKTLKATSGVFLRTIIGQYAPTDVTPSPRINKLTIGELEAYFTSNIYANAEYLVTTSQSSGATIYRGNIEEIMTVTDLSVTFPENWPDNLYIGRFAGTPSPYIGGFSFLGDRSFDKTLVNAVPVVTRYGEPLAGRTVEILRNTGFIIVSEDDYLIYDAFGVGEQGWKVRSDLRCRMIFAGSRDAIVGDKVRLQDNLPELTVVDLLRIIAAHTGTALNYTDKDGVIFETIDADTWPFVDITYKIVSTREVSRTFGDYAQRNILRYESGDGVPEEQRIEEVYRIDNDNIEEVAELVVLPVSEGRETTSDGQRVLSVADVEDSPYILGDANTSAKSMIRAKINKNQTISKICLESTKTVVLVSMSMCEYEQLTPKTTILCKSVKYIWTESSWSDGVATLQLSKF